MKKAIVLGAAMAAFAASDIKFSGSAQAGYSFSFGEDNITRSWKDWDGDDGEGEFDLAISDADGLWSLSFDDGVFGFGDLQVATQIKVNLSKALNKAGVDTGDFGFSFAVGRKAWETELSESTGWEWWLSDHCRCKLWQPCKSSCHVLAD